eukprot:TRINITY_DN43794_c0_g1_i1.p1 TRINITY_DN43794_c0_g1~~TRINITY_DN43794_c0_g1_i1.p1  ORF type:complete len:450 (+),score=82.28 TRINITY_DN43794_c0_g1_i1:133-1350(+)
MKSKAVVEAQVHPLIYQAYKSFWVFATCWLVLLFEPFEFSYWGILSGLSWVPAGVGAVIAVQNVGIAYGQALWQVTIILTNFVWGFGILKDESVKSVGLAVLAVLMIIVGVVGMTLAFNLKPKVTAEEEESASATLPAGSTVVSVLDAPGSQTSAAALGSRTRAATASGTTPANFGSNAQSLRRTMSDGLRSSYALSIGSRNKSLTRRSLSDVRFSADGLEAELEGLLSPEDRSSPNSAGGGTPAVDAAAAHKPSFAVGIAAALFNGVWGGSNLVPAQYAPYHGVHFQISFAVGAMAVTVAMLLIYFLYLKLWWGQPPPALHLRAMAWPGFISGCLWSLGNFCSLYVLNNLGQGIGNAFLQSSVIVSGLWGILYYKEMTGQPVLYWALCCGLCLGGVLLLAHEKG